MIVSTTPNIEGKRITGYFGLVSGRAILGVNIFKDLFAGMWDTVVGRSGECEAEPTQAKLVATKEMEGQARYSDPPEEWTATELSPNRIQEGR